MAPRVAGPAPDPRTLGFEPEATPLGVAWVRRVSVDLAPYLDRAGAGRPVRADQLVGLGCRVHAGEAWVSVPDSGIMVLDIESLGLRGSGVIAFLVGVGVPRGGRLDIDQLLVADMDAEAAMLAAVHARVASARILVSYNGRSFDVPMLIARSVINRMPAVVFEERLHSDLLGPVRRLFRDRLGGCTLRQCEAGLLGFEREDDVPGYEAPARFRAWLQTGHAEVLAGVVRHNELDLCSTMVLAARLADHVAGRLVHPVHPADRYHLGMHLERGAGGEEVEEGPEAHFRAAFAAGVPPWSGRAGHRLAHRLRRSRRTGEAIAVLDVLWSADPRDLVAARSLAICLEREGRHADAMVVARAAADTVRRLPRWGAGRLRGEPVHGWGEDWSRRMARLGIRAERADRRSRHRATKTASRPPRIPADEVRMEAGARPGTG